MTVASSSTHGVAVFIGRFQPFHNGHLALLREALAATPLCVVVIGSAFHARSPRHPFSWQERAEMVRLALPEAERARVRFVPVRDHHDDARWLAAVRAGVAAQLGAVTGRTLLVGHLKDATTDYLHAFPEWDLRTLPGTAPATARGARDALFGQGLEATAPMLPTALAPLLHDWCAQPLFAELQAEWQMLQGYRATWAASPYPPVLVTVDCVVKCGDHVLLIRRGAAPGKGLLAVPGGFMEQRETTQHSALRELEEETHLDLTDADLRACLKATAVFDNPDRSERGRTITHVHFFDLGARALLPGVRADDDAASAAWTPIAEVGAQEVQFMDDHFQMLLHFIDLSGA